MARRPISDLRHEASFRRKSKGKVPRSVTLIVCDGQTERSYFEALRVSLELAPAEVTIPPDITGRSPRQIVDFAAAKGSNGGYGRIFCVFDRDDHASFNDAVTRIRQLRDRPRRPLPISGAVSRPCWEIWVLLHFERTDAPFPNCDDVVSRVRERHMSSYKKADKKTSESLVLRVMEAVANATWLATRQHGGASSPSTTVHHVVQHLQSVASVEPGS